MDCPSPGHTSGWRLRGLVVLLIVSLALAAAPVDAGAVEVERGLTPDIGRGTTIDDDLYLAGGRASIAGRVTGDVIAATARLEMTGQIDGDLDLLAGDVDLRGRVGGTLRVAAGRVRLSGSVGELLVLGGEVMIREAASIAGDLVVTGGTVELAGEVGGRVHGTAERLGLSGRVDGDVRLTVDRLRVGEDAALGGELRYRSGNASVDAGARVAGAIVTLPTRRYLPWFDVPGPIGFALFRLLAGLLAGVFAVMVAPGAAVRTADALRHLPLVSLGFGVVLAVAIPIVVVALVATVVGIPLALMAAALLAIALYLSQVVVGLGIGRALLPKRWDRASRGYNLLAMTIGLVIIAVLRALPVRFVDSGLAVLIAVVGLGGIGLGLRRSSDRSARHIDRRGSMG